MNKAADDRIDPLSELLNLILSFQVRDQDPGCNIFAKSMGVPPWSVDFMRLIWMVNERVVRLKALIAEVTANEEKSSIANGHLDVIAQGFGIDGMTIGWQHTMTNYFSAANINPLKLLTFEIKQHTSSPALTSEEREQLISDAKELLAWLHERSDDQSDFFTNNLISGLDSFIFSMSHLGWAGMSFTMESLREVIASFMALELKCAGESGDIYAAMLMKTGAFIQKAFEKLKVAKSVYEVGSLGLKAYGAVSLIAQTPHIGAKLLGSGLN